MSVTRPIAALFATLAAALAVQAAGAGSLRHVVVDPATGFAIEGYDPVAYFVEGAPRLGERAHEWMHAGAAWRFVNEGNLAAFKADPEVYAPAFGGHCAVAVSRGYPAEGNPQIWEIHDDRLLFFFSESNRQTFLMDPDGILKAAEAAWPQLYPW